MTHGRVDRLEWARRVGQHYSLSVLAGAALSKGVFAHLRDHILNAFLVLRVLVVLSIY